MPPGIELDVCDEDRKIRRRQPLGNGVSTKVKTNFIIFAIDINQIIFVTWRQWVPITHVLSHLQTVGSTDEKHFLSLEIQREEAACKPNPDQLSGISISEGSSSRKKYTE